MRKEAEQRCNSQASLVCRRGAPGSHENVPRLAGDVAVSYVPGGLRYVLQIIGLSLCVYYLQPCGSSPGTQKQFFQLFVAVAIQGTWTRKSSILAAMAVPLYTSVRHCILSVLGANPTTTLYYTLE